jgi:hypothetical protein
MMILTLIPQLAADGDPPLTLERQGETLIVDGVELDFSSIAPGGRLPHAAIPAPRIAGDVTRDADGTLRVPVILPYTDAPLAGGEVPVTEDGPVVLPHSDDLAELAAEGE